MSLLTTRYSKLIRDLQDKLDIYNPFREIEFMLQSLNFIAGPGIVISVVGGTVTISTKPPVVISGGTTSEDSYVRIFLTMGC